MLWSAIISSARVITIIYEKWLCAIVRALTTLDLEINFLDATHGKGSERAFFSFSTEAVSTLAISHYMSMFDVQCILHTLLYLSEG